MRQQVNGAKISPSERVKNPFVSAMINRKKKKIVRALQNDIVFMFYFIFYSLDNEKKKCYFKGNTPFHFMETTLF
jgi:hypothetical protein